MSNTVNTERERIRELTKLLNRASESYYNENTEIMSNLEYDRLYDELNELEKKDRDHHGRFPHCSRGLFSRR